MIKELSPGLTDFRVIIFKKTPNIKTSFSYAVQNSNHPPRYKRFFKSWESHLTVVENVNKARDIKWSVFKDRNIGKFACYEGKRSFVVDYVLIDYDV